MSFGTFKLVTHESFIYKSHIEQVLAATPHKAQTIRPPTSYHENYPI